MQRRGTGCSVGYWSVPGGRRDRVEKLKATAVREVREEVNVRILTIVHFMMTDEVHECCGERWETYWYWSKHFVGTPETSAEVTKLYWASWDDLPTPLWPLFGQNMKLIKRGLG